MSTDFYGSDDDPPVIDAETDLLTAEASAVDGFPTPDDPTEPEPNPIGRTWVFDWSRSRFRRLGLSPVEVIDHDALGVWIETTLRVGRYAYPIFDDDFGLEDAEVPIGELVTQDSLADLVLRIEDALLVHDRIQAVENVALSVDGDTITIQNMEIVLDETNRLSVTDVRVGSR